MQSNQPLHRDAFGGLAAASAPGERPRLADHIVAFSLAALERLADSRPGEPGAEEH